MTLQPAARGGDSEMTAKEVLEFAKQNNVVMVDLRFTDWPGT